MTRSIPAFLPRTALLGASLLLAMPAHAQASPLLADRLDENGDGAVSREEAVHARARLFARMDLNGDGTIDREETERIQDAIMDRAVVLQARIRKDMRRLDADGDAKVSSEEFRARTFLFDLADRDGDGSLSGAELKAVRAAMADR
ncbi:EF-hand domain-containing protein [Gellertiella hungarica]|uniref:EF-hand domain-containing protein n=1 Tax=Gellertiella hungarica TaxID=1572859 RepID=A0A7W6J7M7_9HYPH|nr:EF-hand domain-containing protein [Gellertiella hungarica]MBB4065447.1 hypothetical protein [Gellertiella hungarica]